MVVACVAKEKTKRTSLIRTLTLSNNSKKQWRDYKNLKAGKISVDSPFPCRLGSGRWIINKTHTSLRYGPGRKHARHLSEKKNAWSRTWYLQVVDLPGLSQTSGGCWGTRSWAAPSQELVQVDTVELGWAASLVFRLFWCQESLHYTTSWCFAASLEVKKHKVFPKVCGRVLSWFMPPYVAHGLPGLSRQQGKPALITHGRRPAPR